MTWRLNPVVPLFVNTPSNNVIDGDAVPSVDELTARVGRGQLPGGTLTRVTDRYYVYTFASAVGDVPFVYSLVRY